MRRLLNVTDGQRQRRRARRRAPRYAGCSGSGREGRFERPRARQGPTPSPTSTVYADSAPRPTCRVRRTAWASVRVWAWAWASVRRCPHPATCRRWSANAPRVRTPPDRRPWARRGAWLRHPHYQAQAVEWPGRPQASLQSWSSLQDV